MRPIIRVAGIVLISGIVFFFSPWLPGNPGEESSMIRETRGEEYYREQWKRVDEAMGKGLPKTALEIVVAIYDRARAEKNDAQYIKAVAYRVVLAGELSETGETTLITDLEKEVRTARQPVRSILQSYLATAYWSHYQNNRWEIASRTRVNDAPDADFLTWDAAKFIDTARALFLASIEDASALQAIPIRDFRRILVGEEEKSEYRPTLFDVLAFRALSFFENDETDLPRPAREFELTTLDALATADVFARHAFVAPDETDQQYITVRLYQQLLRFHLSDPSPEALLDLDLQRLSFARKATLHEEADTTYYMQLERLVAAFARNPMAAEVRYRMAEYKNEQGDHVAAMKMCDEVIAASEGTRGAVNCASLKSRILTKDVACAVEQTVLPDKPFLLPVTYRNIPTMYFRIVEMSESDWEEWTSYRRSTEDRFRDVLRKRPLRAWKAVMPDVKDYKTHTVDVKGPETPFGRFLLLCSPDEKFSLEENAIAYTQLTVTQLSLQSQELVGGTRRFWVRDAESGAPLAGVDVEFSTLQWESSTQRYTRVYGRSLRSDRDGMFELEPESSRDYVYVTLRKGADVYRVDQQFYAYRHGRDEEKVRTIFFTDRSLYRPGQTIYFKGIVLRQDAQNVKYRVQAKHATTVTFYDVNNQKIAEQNFRTNEFGSFNGVFTAPAGVLTGAMTIRNENGAVSVRVEEYKRPKFEVAFEPLKGEAALGAIVTVKGSAKAYAGSNIDNAAVTYRVFRRVRFPYWWWWWRPAPGGADKEIAHGTAKTNDAGEFSIDFEAVPDRTVDRKDLPVFTYTVNADVTDINGETRSASTSVVLGYTTLEINATAPEYVNSNEKVSVPVHAANLNGQPLKAAGSAVFERLRTPGRVFRARTLTAPDVFAMDEADFHRSFPHDAFKDEAREDSWAVEETALSGRFSTDDKGNDTLKLAGFRPGRYRMTLTAKDPSGETIILKRFFTVYDPEGGRPPVPEAALFIPKKMDGQPGDVARFLFGTTYSDARVLYQIEHRGRIVSQEWLSLDNTMREFTIPIREEHRGGLSLRFSIVRGYRHEVIERTIHVPWTNKQLSIETSTFRDKMRPGEKEEWRITLKGDSAGRVAAEMLASMYDASLDAIYPHGWNSFAWPSFWPMASLYGSGFGIASSQLYSEDWNQTTSGYYVSYPELNVFLLNYGWGYRYGRRYKLSKRGFERGEGDVMYSMAEAGAPPPPPAAAREEAVADKALRLSDEKKKDGENEAVGGLNAPAQSGKGDDGLGQVKARTNFSETAFFFPAVMTNEKGEYVLSFTVPEALTRWRLMAFAHTPDLNVGYFEHRSVTQKELMVMPNAPRFLREGDAIVFPVKISNLSDTTLEGTAKLQLFDAVTMQPIDALFGLSDALRPFKAAQGASAAITWALKVPEGLTAIVYRVVAKAGSFSDGEEAPLPVLPNRMLVTETLPLNVRGNQTRTYTFDKLVNSGSSKTLRHQKLTLEMTSNPAWYAVQALPYIMEYPYECSEQLFNRFYANSIAAHIVRSNPKIERVFSQWKGTDALVSNLEKNQELKSLLIQETPWVMQGQDEGERKRRIALLFDLNGMANTLDAALRKIEKAQASNGGFPWFPGMPESRYITQYIIAGFGHLRELGVNVTEPRVKNMIERAIEWADREMQSDYERMRREKSFNPDLDHLGYLEIQYLYARSYFTEQEVEKANRPGAEFWRKQAKKFWAKKGLLCEGMIALALHRLDDKKTPGDIVNSLRERAMMNDELGMYWKQNGGWFWWQAPIETQALLVEVFDVVANDENAVEELKIWLLKQKQVQDWKTTVATAEACYALLRRGTDLLASDKLVEVKMGGTLVDPRGDEGKAPEAGTGYYKVSWNGKQIEAKQGNVVVTKSDKGIAWGAVYWQYFEQLDKITPAATPLKIEKELYRKAVGDKGVALEPITSKDPLHVGDLLTARIVIRVDRDMEYVHLKDMRGAGFELVNQLSRYRWQAGFGYYEAPKDASVNFFIYWLPKGVHVFEYSLRVSHQGTFSNGISTIQSMYAPEFAAHTQGFVVTVK
ncbi:MAG: hypothetical protein HY962_03295 [Ignavibacteriae bacterium]|nr:hypothetical protein [Ignavibacteriota bacterium]